MSSTHLSLHYHLVFRTKNDEPVITSAWRDRLHAYLGGVIRTLGGAPEAIGGVADHVHLLVGRRATHTLADMLRELKSVSSKWVHEEVGVCSFVDRRGCAANHLIECHEGVAELLRLELTVGHLVINLFEAEAFVAVRA